MLNVTKYSFDNLKNYCESQNFKGWDPYDGLNSPFSEIFLLKNFKFFRLVWIQFFKKCPINFRSLFLIRKEYNPKGIALFLTGYCNLYKSKQNPDYLKKIHYLADILISLKSNNFSGACWGYNFPWQSRVGYLPKGAPTVVVTSFAAYALMDAYECTRHQKYLDIAMSSSLFVMNDLIKSETSEGLIFSYSPIQKGNVYNASLLGSKLLSRVYKYSKNGRLMEDARASINACVAAQRDDGAWPYGELPFQNWVDSFHTGFNLECISEYQKFSGDLSFNKSLEMGLAYYLNNFFLNDGMPKYYDNIVFPIDIHSPAQLIVTLYRMNKILNCQDLLSKVIEWSTTKMQDDDKGYFYYQLRQKWTCKIPYIRWSQAWMFYALSFYLLFFHKKNG